MQSTAGDLAFDDSRPSKTARVVEMAVNAGLILVGKANLLVVRPRHLNFQLILPSNLATGSEDEPFISPLSLLMDIELQK